MKSRLEDRLLERKKLGNLRQLRMKQDCIDFTSNDYLGLARCGQLQKVIQEKILNCAAYTNGATGSRLLTGHIDLFDQIENKIAKFHHAESALLYNSGYTANLGLLDAILQSNDCLIYDIHIHASLQDGMRLSRVKSFPFRHNDVLHLENRLKSVPSDSKIFVCVESVYSLDGSIAPLQAIHQLCIEYGAHLIIDEAHAIGLLGVQGKGLVAHLKLEKGVFARICTYGKAFGVHGAAVLGSEILRQYLINFSRPFCYTTALPMHSLIAIDCAYDYVRQADSKREHLTSLIAHLHHLVHSESIPLMKSSTPIQGILIPGNKRVRAISEKLMQSDFNVRPIMSPTVKRGGEILRLCLHSFNTHQEVENLVNALKTAIKEIP